MTGSLLNDAEASWASYLWSVWKRAEWDNLPDEDRDYGQRHFGRHLDDAGMPNDSLYALAGEQWFNAWKRVDLTHAGFLEDVRRAWRRAESSPKDAAISFRCALIHSSVAALSFRVPLGLPALAVRHGVCSEERALWIVSRIPDEGPRAEALTKLVPVLSPGWLDQAVAIAGNMKSARACAFALSYIVPYLPVPKLPDVLKNALALKDEVARAGLLESLNPHVPEGWKDDLANAACAIIDEFGWANEAAEFVASMLPLKRMKAELRTARHASERARISVLSALMPIIPDELLTAAWNLTMSIRDERERARLIAKVPIAIPLERWEKAWAKAAKTSKFETRAMILAALLRLTPPPRRIKAVKQIMEVIDKIEEAKTQGQYLASLMPFFDSKQRVTAIWKVLGCMYGLNGDDRMSLFNLLSPHLVTDIPVGALVQFAGELSESTWRGSPQAEVLLVVLPHLDREIRRTYFRMLQNIAARLTERNMIGECPRSKLLIRAARIASKQRRLSLLEMALAINNEYARGQAISGLFPLLPKSLHATLLQEVRSIHDAGARAQTLTEIAPHVTDELRSVILKEALDAGEAIDDHRARTTAETALLPYVQDSFAAELRRNAVDALGILDDRKKSRELVALAGQLPPELLKEVRTIAANLATTDNLRESPRAFALVGLLPYVPKPELPDEIAAAFDAVANMEIKDESAKLLSRLIPCLSEKLLERALEHTRRFKPGKTRADLLVDIVKASPAMLDDALQEARSWEGRDEDPNMEILTGDSTERKTGVADLMVSLLQLADEPLRNELFPEALAKVREVLDHDYRGHFSSTSSFLARLSIYASPAERVQLLEEALVLARNMWRQTQPGTPRASTLCALIPSVPAEMRESIIDDVLPDLRLDPSGFLQTQAVPAHAQWMSRSQLDTLIGAIRDVTILERRARGLASLAPHLDIETLGEETQRILHDEEAGLPRRQTGPSPGVAEDEISHRIEFFTHAVSALVLYSRQKPASAYAIWDSYLRSRSQFPRQMLLQELPLMFTFMAGIVDDANATAEAVLGSIRETARMWP